MPRKGSSKRNKIFDPEQILPVVASDQPLQAARNPPKTTFWDYFGFLSFLRPIIRLLRGRATRDLTAIGRVKKQKNVESNVPLEITLFLNSYLAGLLNNGLVAPAIASGFVTNISNLQDTFNNLERIRNTPLPFAYQTHLRLSLWWVTFAVESSGVKYELTMYRSDRLYLLFLPFQIYSAFKYLTIPYVYCHRVRTHILLLSFQSATAFASFLLLGFLEIGHEMYVCSYGLSWHRLTLFFFSQQRESFRLR